MQAMKPKNKYANRSRISEEKFRQLIKLFAADFGCRAERADSSRRLKSALLLEFGDYLSIPL